MHIVVRSLSPVIWDSSSVLSFMTMTFSKHPASCFVSCPAIYVMFPQDYIQVLRFWQENHRNYVLFTVHRIRRHTISICPITGEVNL